MSTPVWQRTTGIYTAEDVIKMLMAGADVTMLCSALLRHGVGRISEILTDLKTWMGDHDYDSINTMKGQHEPAFLPGTGRLRTCQLHEGSAKLYLRNQSFIKRSTPPGFARGWGVFFMYVIFQEIFSLVFVDLMTL